MTVTWTAPVWNGGRAITGYNVYRATVSGAANPTLVTASPLAASARTFVATGLTPGTRYYFTVKALNAIGASALSNQRNARPT